MKQPKISIVIPVYNVEEYISECLKSVMRQTYAGPMECVLVDDCGTDNSVALAKQIISQYDGTIDFRIVHHEHNRGLSAARNTGTDKATGEYIYYLDSDDFIDPDTIQLLYSAIASGDFAMAIGYALAYCNGNDGIFKPEWVFDESRLIQYDQFVSRMLMQKSIFTAWGKLFNRDILADIRFREGRLNEDTLFIIDLGKVIENHRYTCVELPLYSYHYRMRDESICHKSEYKLDVAYVENIDVAIEQYKDRAELYDWLKRDQIRRCIKALRDKEIDKLSYKKMLPYIMSAQNNEIQKATTNKGFVRMMMVKYLPHIAWVLRKM